MHNASLFQSLAAPERVSLSLTVAGKPVTVREGDSVAVALLVAGCRQSRTTPASGTPRAPYCLMGVCFECLVEIDGMPNRQACMTLAEEGMVVELQRGAREAGVGS